MVAPHLHRDLWYRSWLFPTEVMFWLTMGLMAVTFIVAIPTGVSRSVPRVREKASQATRVALWTTGLVVLIMAGAIYGASTTRSLFPAPQQILHAWQEDPTTIRLHYGCPSQPSIEVEEDPDQVVVTIRGLTTLYACARGNTMSLDEPLGDRPLVDGATEARIEVENRLIPERS